jgi:hypothetical protein
MGFLSALGEYFLGTECHRLYERERRLYREFIRDPSALKKQLRDTNQSEFIYLAMGKALPILMDAAGIALAFLNKDPKQLCLVGLGELSRLASMQINRGRFADIKGYNLYLIEEEALEERLRGGYDESNPYDKI